jgi:hypothetical protein
MEPRPLSWHWRLLDTDGATTEDAAFLGAVERRFGSRSDAETWLGESWPDLWSGGVAAVELYEDDRCISGAIPLRPLP